MLQNDTHKRAMDRLEQLIDLDWVAESDAVQQALWDGRPFSRLPCIVSTPTPPDWPRYPFTERWDDVEKPFIHLMGDHYIGALLKDDRALHIEPDYGEVYAEPLILCRDRSRRPMTVFRVRRTCHDPS
jgi:hypothetical protein